MELTPDEALDLLRELANDARAARSEWDRARDLRDEVIALLDGQEGMSRTAMAEACGITRMALWKTLERRPEALEQNVLVSDHLRRALAEVFQVAALDADERVVAFDVHA